jgi:hypothetical protein
MRRQRRACPWGIASQYFARRVSVLIIPPVVGIILWVASKVYLVSELLTLFAFLTGFFVFGTGLLFLFVLFQEAVSWGVRRIRVHWRTTLYASQRAEEGAVVLLRRPATEETRNSEVSAAVAGR